MLLALVGVCGLLLPVGMREGLTLRPLHVPQTVLWVWDRPMQQPLESAAVAYLYATVRLTGERASTYYRQWRLKVSNSTVLIPVVHVDVDNLSPPSLNVRQQAAIAMAVRQAAQHASGGWVQLDFEVRRSQRIAYQSLLHQLQPLRHSSLSGNRPIRLSVTALASWCMDDAWLDGSLIDEVVPMFFRMGRDGPAIQARLVQAGHAPVPACRGAAGFIYGEPIPGLDSLQRRYVFHPASWTPADMAHLNSYLPAD